MKYAKFLVALLAVCTLIIPAFSMSDFGNGIRDCKEQKDCPCLEPMKGDIAGPQPCPCSKDKMGPNGDKLAPTSMMNGKKEMKGPEGDKPMMGQDNEKPAPMPMMDGNEKPMMGQDNEKPAPMPMMDGCDKPMMGQDNEKPAPMPMMDGCKKPMKGPNGDKNQDYPCHNA